MSASCRQKGSFATYQLTRVDFCPVRGPDAPLRAQASMLARKGFDIDARLANVPLQPRRFSIALSAVGCKRMLAGG